MIILGINAYHGDSSAAVICDGVLVAAIEEERIVRQKHWAGFPVESIKWCLAYAGKDIREIDYIAISRNPWARLHKKIARAVLKRKTPAFVRGRIDNYKKIHDIKTNLAQAFGVDARRIKARVINVEHHLAHLASSFFVSPFEEAAVVSIDGFGDFASLMTGLGRAHKLTVRGTVEFPHSLGVFYTALTQFLGFPHYGDEYKVMGLSAYGKPAYLEVMRKIVKLKKNGLFELDTGFFLHDSQGVEMTWLNTSPVIGRLFSDRLIDVLGQPRGKEEELGNRYQDIAASVQAMYEEAFVHILTHLYRDTGITRIALAGGCIQNSLANGRIYEQTPFREVYIPPAAHDAGGAVGAAFYAYNQLLGNPRHFVMDSPYWGPAFKEDEIEAVLRKEGVTSFEKLTDTQLFERAAQDISDGKVVGWFQGRTEWGPRALGNRSIIADPRKKEMQDILNERVKRREWFRPFAPSVLEEKAAEWFERGQAAPFMEKVYRIKPGKKHLIPAVCHVDATGRLQTVSAQTNPKYYALIKAFESRTGVPIVLNTSFNENEPIVNTPAEALRCFRRTEMDVLVMENFYLSCSP